MIEVGPMDRKAVGRGVRHGGLIAAAGTFLVVLLVALVPVSQAAAARPLTIIPINSLADTYYTVTDYGGCATAKVVHAPAFSYTTHEFKGAAATTAPYCPSGWSTNEGTVNEELVLQTTPASFAHSGNYLVKFVWNFTVDETWDFSPFSKCVINYANPTSECATGAWVELEALAVIYDDSNSTWGPYGEGYAESGVVAAVTSNYVENFTFGNYSGGPTGAGSFSGYVNGTTTLHLSGSSSIVRSDTYTIQALVAVDAGAYALAVNAKATGKALASASVNCATAGNHGLLRSVTES